MHEKFDQYLPVGMRELSSRHWSDARAIYIASNFLCSKPNSKILDIGSGVGKFCILGSKLNPNATFFGVEKRHDFVKISNRQKVLFNAKNCEFIHADIRDFDCSTFDGVFFFNSFLEYIDPSAHIDAQSNISTQDYIALSHFVFQSLYKMKPGTRLAAYHAPSFIIPSCYRLISMSNSRLMKFYIKDSLEIAEIFCEAQALKYCNLRY